MIAEGLPVIAAPGASAVLTALSVAGLPTDRFMFAGFLPVKQAARCAGLTDLAAVPATLVFYESPRRLAATLADMATVLGDRPAAVCRELTKKFEETRRGTLATLADRHRPAAGHGPDRRGPCCGAANRAGHEHAKRRSRHRGGGNGPAAQTGLRPRAGTVGQMSKTTYLSGLAAEEVAERLYTREGAQVRDRRALTEAGEIDLIVEQDGQIIFVEVKARRSHAAAAASLSPKQQVRIMAAAEIWLDAQGLSALTLCRFDLVTIAGDGTAERLENVLSA